MAKKRKHAPPPQAEPEAHSRAPGDERANHNKMRALIISALAAGGVFQMNNWQIQAHGNRSSHSVLAFQAAFISPDDFLVLRRGATAPNLPGTAELLSVTERIHALQGSRPIQTQTAEVQSLLKRKNELEAQAGAPSNTTQILAFLRQGDADAAVAAIEGQGWPERVLGDYLWALLDIAYLDGDSKKFTDEQAKDFIAVARPAVAYTEKTLGVLKGRSLAPQELAAKDRAAEILHNVASFIVLMDNADAETLKLGQTAAERALLVRQELNQPPEIMRANWMAAQYPLRAGQTAEALRYLNTSLRQAEQLKDVSGIAWAKHSMAQALRKTQPAQAAKLDAEVRQLVNNFRGKDTSIDFLRQEIGGNKTG